MYSLLHTLFGWDYIAWKNNADSGVARVYKDGEGVVYYFRYRSTSLVGIILKGTQVIWLTCPILGIPLKLGEGRVTEASPSLDKFNPSLGYIKGNVHVLSHKANTMKLTATTDEVYKLYLWMKQQENKNDNKQSKPSSPSSRNIR